MTMSVLIFGTAIGLAESGPFENFFHKLKRAFREPQETSHPHRTGHKETADTQNSKSDTSSNHSSTAETPAPRSNHSSTAETQAPPNERNTRAATRVASKKGGDLRYGTPVPGKQGFVTSPFSPDNGYIDVRGFAPGTAVKDPYTGKIFLTP
jgi:hypothetical protein